MQGENFMTYDIEALNLNDSSPFSIDPEVDPSPLPQHVPLTLNNLHTKLEGSSVPSTLKNLHSELDTLKKENFTLKTELFHLRAYFDSQNNQDVADVQRQNIELKTKIEGLTFEVNESNVTLQKTALAITSLASDKDRLENEKKRLEEYVGKYEQQSQNYEQNKKELDRCQRLIQDLRSEEKSLREQLELAEEKDIDDDNNQMEMSLRIDEEMSELRDNAVSLEAELVATKASAAASASEVSLLKDALSGAEKQNAELYRQCEQLEQFRVNENTVPAGLVDTLQTQVSHQLQQLSKLREENTDLKKKVAETDFLQQECDSMRQQSLESRAGFIKLRDELLDKDDQINELQEQFFEKDQQIKELEENRSKWEKRDKGIHESLMEKEEMLKEMQGQFSSIKKKLHAQLNSKDQELLEKAEHGKELEEKIHSKDQELDSLRKKARDIQLAQKENGDHSANLEKQIQEFKDQLDKKTNDLSRLETRLKEAELKLKNKNDALFLLEDQLKDSSAQKNKTIEQLERHIKQNAEKVNSLEKKVTSQNEQMDILKSNYLKEIAVKNDKFKQLESNYLKEISLKNQKLKQLDELDHLKASLETLKGREKLTQIDLESRNKLLLLISRKIAEILGQLDTVDSTNFSEIQRSLTERLETIAGIKNHWKEESNKIIDSHKNNAKILMKQFENRAVALDKLSNKISFFKREVRVAKSKQEREFQAQIAKLYKENDDLTKALHSKDTQIEKIRKKNEKSKEQCLKETQKAEKSQKKIEKLKQLHQKEMLKENEYFQKKIEQMNDKHRQAVSMLEKRSEELHQMKASFQQTTSVLHNSEEERKSANKVMEDENNGLRTKIRLMDQQFSDAQNRFNQSLDKEMLVTKELNKTISQLTNIINNLKQEKTKLIASNETFSNENDKLTSQCSSLQHDLHNSNVHLKKTKDKLMVQISQITGEKKSLELEIRGLKKQLREFEDAGVTQDSQSQTQSFLNQIDTLQREKASLKKHYKQAYEKMTEFQKAKTTLETNNKQFIDQFETLQKDYATLETQNNNMLDQISSLQQEKTELETGIRQFQEQISFVEQENTMLKTKMAEFEASITGYSQILEQYGEKEKLIDTLKAENLQYKQELQNMVDKVNLVSNLYKNLTEREKKLKEEEEFTQQKVDQLQKEFEDREKEQYAQWIKKLSKVENNLEETVAANKETLKALDENKAYVVRLLQENENLKAAKPGLDLGSKITQNKNILNEIDNLQHVLTNIKSELSNQPIEQPLEPSNEYNSLSYHELTRSYAKPPPPKIPKPDPNFIRAKQLLESCYRTRGVSNLLHKEYSTTSKSYHHPDYYEQQKRRSVIDLAETLVDKLKHNE